MTRTNAPRKLFSFTSIGIFVLALCCIALLSYTIFHATALNQPKIFRGTITKVLYHENEAENGYYSIQVKDIASAQTYQISADGFMNTPLSPESQGMSCVSVPPHIGLEGATVEFNLPEEKSVEVAPGDTTKYVTTCYKIPAADHYFFNVLSYANGAKTTEAYAMDLLQKCQISAIRVYDYNGNSYLKSVGAEFAITTSPQLMTEYDAAQKRCGTSFFHDTGLR
jgi:hypothetical protein